MTQDKTAIIVGAGDFTDRGLNIPADMIIAADAGLRNIRSSDIKPDVIIGDYDSLGYVPDGTVVALI